MIREKFFLDRETAVLVVIDIQEKLCRAMDPEVLEKLKKNVTILLEAAKELGIPTVVTEQYPQGLGETLTDLKAHFPEGALEKMSFSCCGDPRFLERMKGIGRKQAVLVGMETHVCVLQTVLEFLEAGYHVHLVKDAVMSRSRDNWRTGLKVAAAAGAVVTSTEAALFQFLKCAGTDEFRKLSKLVR
jgi:nicotinamidase-related amidase